MINEAPLARFRPLGDGPLLRPIYADYAFANLPTTVEFLLTGERRRPLLPARSVFHLVLRAGPPGCQMPAIGC